MFEPQTSHLADLRATDYVTLINVSTGESNANTACTV